MDRLVSSARAREIDVKSTEESEIPSVVLMEEAGVRIFDALVERIEPGRRVVVLSGSGNNGGDALVVARHAWLRRTWDVRVVVFESPRSESCRLQSRIVERLGVPTVSFEDGRAIEWLERADAWIDGIWGIGLRGPLNGDVASSFERLVRLQEQTDRDVFAIDVPSGVCEGGDVSSVVLRCRQTFALGYAKQACYSAIFRAFAGRIQVLPLGFSFVPTEEIDRIDERDLPLWIDRWSANEYKNSKGRVEVWAGSIDMPGAAILCARSSFACGAGLVCVSADLDARPAIASAVASVLFRGESSVPHEVPPKTAFVVGPGWGRRSDRVDTLRSILDLDAPTVVDADAIDALAKLRKRGWSNKRGTPFVVTPHPGEYANLLKDGLSSDLESFRTVARDLGAVVVYKASVTWIVTPDGRARVWDGQNAALGVAGSGDCLAGSIGAFLARGANAFDAACAAVVVHGTVARRLFEEKGVFSADELPAALSLACAGLFSPL